MVLPGVGAFAACMAALEARPGVVEAITHAVKGRGAPFLGICVGLQLLAARGLEFGETAGLGWIEGEVVAIEPAEPARMDRDRADMSAPSRRHDAAPRAAPNQVATKATTKPPSTACGIDARASELWLRIAKAPAMSA